MSFACHIHLHVILFFMITRFWDWIWRKKATILSTFVDEILMTIFIWYRVKIERLSLMPEHQQNDQCVANTARECKKVTRFWGKHPDFIALQPSVVRYPRKLETLISATLQLHISDFIFWSQDISTYRCGSFKKAKWWVPNKCRVTYSPWQKQ